MAAFAAVVTLSAVEADAQKAEDRLVFLAAREPPSFDFYMQTNREGVILNRIMFDGLVRTDPITGEVTPGLATEWEYVDATTINFKLREGVTFHNGEAFDAEDVVFTHAYNTNPENRTVAQSRTNWIERVEVHGPYDITLHLPRPFPAAMEFLNANFPIYPADYFAEVGTEGFSAQPVGTGRYTVDSAELGREIVMSRNHDYWGEDNGHIETIVMRFVPEQNTQIAELMSGNAQLIWQVPPDQARRMGQMPTVDVTVGETMRMGYLQFDSGLNGGEPSPVHDRRVRQAIAHAVDRQAIVDNIMGGGSVLHLPCYTTQFGCKAEGAPVYEYDPEKARALLAEAGYPDGFTIDFYGYRDRPVAEAVMGYLSEVGIEANLQWLQYSALRDRVRNDEVDFNFMAWGSSSINDIANSTSYFFKGGPDDTTNDPDVIEWLTAGDSAVGADARQEPYSRALTRIMEEVYWVPMMSYAYYYAMASDLEFTPTPDEIVHLYDARWR
jgi:peptide/nickel transport system substrate-binding protein